MINLSKEINEWIKELPLWQKHALKQIWQTRKISEHSRNIYLSCIKKENLLFHLQHIGDVLLEEDFDFLPKSSKKGEEVTLKAIFDLKNVNAISEDSILTFGFNSENKGITVIYGQNGSGKSGFARVLKNACRARGERQRVLPNIFEATNGAPAEAKFIISEGAKAEEEIHWIDGEIPPEKLSSIAVFDNNAARFYLEKENLIYVPYGLDIFQPLVDLCKALQCTLKQELLKYASLLVPCVFSDIEGINKDFKNFFTKLRKLSEGNKFNDFYEIIMELNRLCVFDGFKEKELEKLRQQLRDDPRNKALLEENFKNRLNVYKSRIKPIQGLFSEVAVKEMGNEYSELLKLKLEAEKYTKELFNEDFLLGTGGEDWQAMYDQAEKYSKVAYVGREFPAIEDDCVCLLCQQRLEEESIKRFKKFEKFMEVQRKANSFKSKKEKYVSKWKEYKTLNIEDFKPDVVFLKEIEQFDPHLKKSIEDFFEDIKDIQVSLNTVTPEDSWNKISHSAIDLENCLKGAIDLLVKDINHLNEAAKPEERKIIEDAILILEAQKHLKNNRHIIISYLADLWQKRGLSNSFKSIKHGAITNKGKELIGLCVTEELRKAFKEERTELKADKIPIKIEDFGELGGTFSRLRFEKCCLGEKENLSLILSEGEQKIIAIASFLAELKAGKRTCGIVFDDPVSSLDHRWKEIVAKRLVKECLKRQVIIFTHDITFLLEIKNEARKQSANKHLCMVYREGEKYGIAEQDAVPWDAKNSQEKLDDVKKKLADLKKKFPKTTESLEYEKEVHTIYEFLRETWESTIEDCLFRGVIRRFQNEIKTQSLREVIVKDEDYKAVYNGMEECSKWAHSKPAAKQGNLPDLEKITGDICKLEEYRKNLSDRKKELNKERASFLEAPKCETIDIVRLRESIMKREQKSKSLGDKDIAGAEITKLDKAA